MTISGLAFPDPDDAEFIVENGVRSLTPAHKKTVRYHLAVGTPVLVGDACWDWAIGGAGAVAVLAVARDLPPKDVHMVSEDVPAGAPEALRLMGGARFLGACRVLDAAKVAECIARGLA